MTGGGVDVLITGAGSLAAAIVDALAVHPGPVRALAIGARPSQRATWLARSAAARAAACGHALRVEHAALDWDDAGEPARTFGALRPRVVVHTASLHSPWPRRGAAWEALVQRAGYGLTLPLQLALALRVGRAVAAAVPDARYVNACYPDAVNPMLAAAGVPIACGVGNVAILAALLAAEAEGPGAGRWQVIAHHAHVSAAIGGAATVPAPRAFLDGTERDVAPWLARAALPADDRLNRVTGATAVPLLHALVRGVHRGHAPGPGGRPGGYPVSVRDGEVALDLPPAIDETEAIAHNRAAAASDGVVVDADGRASVTDAVRAVLAEQLDAGAAAELGARWTAADVDAMAARLLSLRDGAPASPRRT